MSSAGGLGRPLRAALAFFFLSGITGLVYEVLWTRRLTLTFGHTVLAVSTVLTAFMAGLAVGSLLAGRWTDRVSQTRNPLYFLTVYGRLEFFIGVWALLSLPLLGLVEMAYLKLSTSGISGTSLYLACFVGSMITLMPPTTAMGATVPVMSRLLIHVPGDIGRLLSRLYGINTLGAVTGAGLAGFVLLPALGLKVSLVLAALVNLGIGVAAMKLGQGTATLADAGEDGAADLAPQAGAVHYPAFVVPLCFALAGTASMAYQIGWTRGLALSLGSSVYAFSAILVTFLTGLGLGSLIYPLTLGRREPDLGHLAALQLGVGLCGALTIPALGLLPYLFYLMFPLVDKAFWSVLGLDLLLAGGLLIVPTLLMGLAFPLATHLYSRDMRLLGQTVGTVYSANTFGCIVGSFAAGFWLVPQFGAQWTLQLAAAVNLLTALALFALVYQYRPSRRVAISSLAAAALLGGVFWLPRWETGVMGGGVSVYAGRHLGMSLSQLRRSLFRPPAFYRDGLSCTVSVNLYGREQLAMRVNGKVDASLGKLDKQTMYLTGYLPGLLHPNPKSVAVVGLGSGLTLEALARVPGVERIDCAELEKAVVQAGYYWRGFNGAVLDDPRVQLHVTDGRTFILGSPRKYDIIASEPSNPWIAGIGNLYTRDFYQTCRDRLNPGGIMCQWFNLYSVSESDLAMVLHSFFDAFPEGMVWQSAPGDLLLIGSQTPVKLDMARVEQICGSHPEVQRHFFEIGLYWPENLLGHFLLSRQTALQAFAQAPFNTDDRPLLEFSAPLSLYREDQVARNLSVLRALHSQTSAMPDGFEPTPENLAMACFGWLNTANTAPVRSALPKLPEGPVRALIEANLALAEGDTEGGQARLTQAVARYPSDSLLALTLANLWLEKGQAEPAAQLFQKVLKHPPSGSLARVNVALGMALSALKRWSEAGSAFFAAAAATSVGYPYTLMGQTLMELGQHEMAIRAFHKALDRNPTDFEAWAWSGKAHLRQGKYQEATADLEAALQLVPDDLEALMTLGLVCIKQERADRALVVFERLLHYYPDNQDARKYVEQLRAL